MNSELLSFVREALGKGVSREKIKDTLLAAGWGQEDVKSALDVFLIRNFRFLYRAARRILPRVRPLCTS